MSVKRGRGRPKGSGTKPIKKKNTPKKRGHSSDDESEDGHSPPRKRGRPKGSTRKAKLDSDDEEDSGQNTPKRTRGRPKKSAVKGKRGRPKKIFPEGEKSKKTARGSQSQVKRVGRPKGSRNKEITIRVESTSGRPMRLVAPPEKLDTSLPKKRMGKRGRPVKHTRGRPRKNPLPPEEEPYVSRVWKALGRPRKYPKEDQPEGEEPASDAPRRGRGRPRKSESKKGAHLKRVNSDGTRGRSPKVAKDQEGPPRKRGRPKGSVKKKPNTSPVKTSTDSSDDIPQECAPSNENEENDDNAVVSM